VEQGKALYDAGKFSSAAAVLQQAVATFKTQGDVLKTAMTLSNLSLTYQQLGLWSEAQQAIADSLKLLQSGENSSSANALANSRSNPRYPGSLAIIFRTT
jgi:tetratricopeptide (TPR) repeat protein